ncbi:MAG TPA: 50S ribosomal protein L11 methyltransferase [Solirubrobacteraceae bacterium]|nr:50S ribosomal protein L11 methyltransferase [Solirubrobacteraceae bacterium]
MIRLAVRVRRAQAEFVLAELLELAPSGVEEALVDEHTVEYAVYGAPGELPDLPDLKAAAGEALVDISTSETADDWHERWRQFHRPVLVEPSSRWPASASPVPALHVRPPWEPASTREDVEEIVIDPAQAFGTGGHATTRLCLQMLLELAGGERGRGPLLDVGTGSGVLAIAAARLGFAPVLALDHDPLSVDAARVNAAVNEVRIELRRMDLRNDELPWLGACDAPAGEIVLLANLLAPLLLNLAATIAKPPAQMIASGLLREQVDEIVRTFGERHGLRERTRSAEGEWAAVWLVAR